MINILITGSKGQLGSEIQALHVNYPQYNFTFTDRDELDITNIGAISLTCKKKNITHIINCAAYTAVDNAEEDTKTANAINHLATQYLAEVAKEHNITLLHVSTDYVFDGTNHKPYIETDTTNPQGVYGKTKLDGEKALLHVNPKNSIIIRTSWVYSSFGENFVKTMLRLGKERNKLGVIFDQIGTPTYARDLAQAILAIIDCHASLAVTEGGGGIAVTEGGGGVAVTKDCHCEERSDVAIYHYSNEGVCSWYDFAKAIFELSNVTCKVNPIETKEYPTPASRPHYSLLNKAKIKKEYNITIPYWKESLRQCLNLIK
ncbi:MAG: dTDP-4-dehydrorhamnose reductase [Campylobacterota bacterium]|nr:dTDP-4-dehydrorhamnose reductase [Campylobacterota bacterium]